MVTKDTTCTGCGLSVSYWTKNNYINCTKCNEAIRVEPCEDAGSEEGEEGD